MRRSIVIVSCVILFCNNLVFANTITINNSPVFQATPQLKPQLIRDPFTPSNLMYEVASNLSFSSRSGNGFLPSQGVNSTVPKMRLKGFIGGESENIALLEIAGSGIYMVRDGDEINYDPSQPRSAIRVTQIQRASITIETGVIGTIRVQR